MKESWRQTLGQTWPGWVGILAGIVVLIGVQGAFEIHPSPEGVNWYNYRITAFKILNPHVDAMLDPLRPPLYSYMLGELGQRVGFITAATWIGSTAGVLMVLAAGLLAWALAGPWAGGAAALTLSFSPLLVAGSHWMNLYPLMGASVGLGFAAAACSWRWLGPGWVGLAGLASGLTFAIDVRGVAATGLVVGCVLLSIALRTPNGSRRGYRVALVALLLGTTSIFPGLGWKVAAFDVTPAAEQTAFQHPKHLMQVKITMGGDPEFPSDECDIALCAGTDDPHLSPTAILFNRCNRFMARWNYRRMTEQMPVPAQPRWPLLLFLPLTLIPARWGGRRSVVIAAILFGAAFLAYARSATTLRLQLRYLCVLQVFFASVIPVALYRLVDLVRGRWALPAHGLGTVCALLAAMGIGIIQIPSDDVFMSNHDRLLRSVVQWFDGRLEPQDTVRECAELNFEVLRLNEPLTVEMAMTGVPHQVACREYVAAPPEGPGVRWLVTGKVLQAPEEIAPEPLDPEAAGWSLETTFGHPTGRDVWASVWRYTGSR